MNKYGLGAQRAALGGAMGSSLFETKLTAKTRNAKPDSAFAMPDTRKFPVDDRTHASNALSRSSGKACHAQVKKKACHNFPDLPSCKNQANEITTTLGR